MNKKLVLILALIIGSIVSCALINHKPNKSNTQSTRSTAHLKSDPHCTFCKIIAGTEPSTIITQNKEIMVIESNSPRRSIHYLIMPKKHIKDLNALSPSDARLMGNIMLMAQQLGTTVSDKKSFKIECNNGSYQAIPHLHFHFLAEK